MSKDFFAYKALSKLNDESIDTMLTECGKACSESYTKQIYIDEYKKAKDLNDFLIHLKSNFTEIKINKISENKLEIIYSFCAGDIVKHGFVSDPKFCICSQKSLLTNWEAILGEGNVQVTLIKSILAKDKMCKFAVEILS